MCVSKLIGVSLCYRCEGVGKIHELSCPSLVDAEVTCVCGMPLCPVCKGRDEREILARRFQDTLRLLGRANEALKMELGEGDREFVEDLVLRLAGGNAPRWSDHFRLEEVWERGFRVSGGEAGVRAGGLRVIRGGRDHVVAVSDDKDPGLDSD